MTSEEHRDAELDSRIADLEQRSKGVQDSLSRLERRTRKRERPWYRNVSVMVALGSFVLSVISAATSLTLAQIQRVETARSDLRAMLQRLAVLPLEAMEKRIAYGGRPELDGILGALREEHRVLMNQARDVAQRIQDDLSADELLSVVRSLATQGQFEEATPIALAAMERADDQYMTATALEHYASLLLRSGRMDEGRQRREEVVALINEFPDYYMDAKQRDLFRTYTFWTEDEILAGDCDQAQMRLETAVSHLELVDVVGPHAPLLQEYDGISRMLFDFCGIRLDHADAPQETRAPSPGVDGFILRAPIPPDR